MAEDNKIVRSASAARSLRVILSQDSELSIVNGFDGQILVLFVSQDARGGHQLDFVNADAHEPRVEAHKTTTYVLVFDQENNSWVEPSR
jgi:hypothetical protein